MKKLSTYLSLIFALAFISNTYSQEYGGSAYARIKNTETGKYRTAHVIAFQKDLKTNETALKKFFDSALDNECGNNEIVDSGYNYRIMIKSKVEEKFIGRASVIVNNLENPGNREIRFEIKCVSKYNTVILEELYNKIISELKPNEYYESAISFVDFPCK